MENKKRGLTVALLVFVFVIIGFVIFSKVAVKTYDDTIDKFKDSANQRTAELVISEVELAYESAYFTNNRAYPTLKQVQSEYNGLYPQIKWESDYVIGSGDFKCDVKVVNNNLKVNCLGKETDKEMILSNEVVNEEDASNNNEVVEPSTDVKKYTIYSKGQEVKLSDNSEWMVLKDSDETTDYVVLLSKKDHTSSQNNYYISVSDEVFNNNTQYDSSSLKQYLNTLETNIPVTLVEKDGYKIRLITIEEIFAFDNKWTYNNENDSYTYNGTNLNDNFRGILTMTHTKCSEGKCTPFYNLSETQCLTEDCNKQYFLEHWMSGLGGIKPVINVSKESLVK